MMSFKFNIFFLFRKTSEQKSAIKDGIRAMSQGCSLLGFVIAKLTTLVRSLLHATLFCQWGYQRVNKIVKFKWNFLVWFCQPKKNQSKKHKLLHKKKGQHGQNVLNFVLNFFLICPILITSLGTPSQLNNRMNSSSVQKPHFTQQVLQSVLCLVVTIKIKRPWSRIF